MQIAFLLTLQHLSFATSMAARIVFALHALDLGASAFEVGLLAAVFQGPALLLSFAIGILADRFGARWLLATGVLCGAAGLLLAGLTAGMPALYAAAALCGMWSPVAAVVVQKHVGSLSTRETLARNLSNQALSNSLTGVTGPLYAGYMVEHLGHPAATFALLPFAALVVLMLLAGGKLLPGAQGRSETAHAPIRFDSAMWRLMMTTGAVQLAVELYPFYLPLYGHAIGLPASVIGMAVSSAYVATFFARAMLPRLVGRFRDDLLLGGALAFSGLAFALVPLAESPAALVAVSLLHGAGMAFGGPLVLMLVYRGVPPERAGTVLGLRVTANSAVRVAAPPLFGALVALIGLTGVFLTTAALIGAASWAIGARRPQTPR